MKKVNGNQGLAEDGSVIIDMEDHCSGQEVSDGSNGGGPASGEVGEDSGGQVSSDSEEMEAALAQAEEEIKELRARVLRSAADMENLRRRNQKEVEDARNYGINCLLQALLPAMDSIDRAEENLTQADKDSPVGQGLALIHCQFVDALSKYGVVGFDSVGEKFDPTRHEAMATESSAEHPKGTVIKQWQKGYFIKDRLFRPAMVIVSDGPPDKA